jgi:hypothetical protein
LVGTILLLGAIWGLKNYSDEVKEVENDMKNATVAVVDSSASLATNAASCLGNGLSALGSFFLKKLPNRIALNIPENGIENNLIKYIEDADAEISKEKWFNFDRINFETSS